MTAIRIHALINGNITKTYLSGAPTIFEAVTALDALFEGQGWKARIVKAEYVEIN